MPGIMQRMAQKTSLSDEPQALSDEQIADIARRCDAADPAARFWREFARAIEAAVLASHRAPEQEAPEPSDNTLARAANMLTAYAELVKATGKYAEMHYIPEIEWVAGQLTPIGVAPERWGDDREGAGSRIGADRAAPVAPKQESP